MTVSIIIAVKIWQGNLEECVDNCRRLDYSDFEIIVLPDAEIPKKIAAKNADIKIIPTGCVNPAQKRDTAIKYAMGDILAFIDDDAYPVKDWLKQALEDFKDPGVAAVGGPAITPLNDTLRQKASGMVYSSFLVSAGFAYRYLAKKRRDVDDYPSCNFLVRKSIIQELGGFKTNFWPGEDTKLCLDITKTLGKRIIYQPKAVVYHHRRPLYSAHLKQIASYALHRGYFVKIYPQTSLKFSYFVPTLFVCFVLTVGVLSVFFIHLRMFYLLSLGLYLFLALAGSLACGWFFAPWVFLGIILTHFTYGFYFLGGLFSKRLKEE